MPWPFSHWTWRDLTRAATAECDQMPPGITIAAATAAIEGLVGRHYAVEIEAMDYNDGEELIEGYEAGDSDYVKGMRLSPADPCAAVPKWSTVYLWGNPLPDPACNDTPPPGELVVASAVKVYKGRVSVDGGDEIEWDGMLTADGDPPAGAEGTGSDYFKSTSPDEYQHSFAVAAGSAYRVAGYYKGTAIEGVLKFAFGTAAAGSDSHIFGPTIIDETTLYTTPADEPTDWTAAFTLDLTAPTGTVSAALGRDGSVNFDEVTIDLLEEGEPVAIGPCP